MAADAYRDRTASHRRKTHDIGAGTLTVTVLGDVRIGADATDFEAAVGPFIEAEQAAFDVRADPEDDIRTGDLLILTDGTELEVVRAPSFPFPPSG